MAKTEAEKEERRKKWSSGISKGIEAIGAASDIAGTAIDLAKTDSSKVQEKVDDIAELKQQEFDSFDALSDAYQRLGGMTSNFSASDIRNLSTGQAVGGALKSTLSGASAGLSVGGPWGAAAGAAIGLGGAIGGIFAGNSKARREAKRLSYEAKENMRNLRTNLNVANDNLMSGAFRAGVANRAAYGGFIERPLERFTRRLMSNASDNDVTRDGRLVRIHRKGGLCIRIKR